VTAIAEAHDWPLAKTIQKLITAALDAWLTGKARAELLRPAPNDLLRMWPVSKRVNVSGRGDDDPGLIEPVEDEAIATS
jgi:putative SOS response-associated peptidase YedK